mmetsp:Transcript_54266/g.116547  ORF Transcript_54266/g.116547 Transcript_54266/m.116547 type:complete len:259 (+) Transcript_54266:1729-2505(+)
MLVGTGDITATATFAASRAQTAAQVRWSYHVAKWHGLSWRRYRRLCVTAVARAKVQVWQRAARFTSRVHIRISRGHHAELHCQCGTSRAPRALGTAGALGTYGLNCHRRTYNPDTMFKLLSRNECDGGAARFLTVLANITWGIADSTRLVGRLNRCRSDGLRQWRRFGLCAKAIYVALRCMFATTTSNRGLFAACVAELSSSPAQVPQTRSQARCDSRSGRIGISSSSVRTVIATKGAARHSALLPSGDPFPHWPGRV